MSMIRVSCPHCAFSRDVPADTVPDRPVQATCPMCKQSFAFCKELVAPPASVPADTGPPALPPEPPHAPPLVPPPSSPSGPASGTGRPAASGELLSVGELFSATWNLYKQRWILLIGLIAGTASAVALPPVLVGVITGGLGKGSFSATVVTIMLFGLALIGSMVLLSWGMTATVAAAVDKTLDFRSSLNRAKGCWISFVWVSFLYSFIVGGASLLFIIPGILSGSWFFACPYLVIDGETRGMDALLKSKALVDGRFWQVLGRLALIWLLGMVAGMLPVVGPLFSLAMVPFSLLYSVMLFRNLSETAGTLSYSATDGTKAGWLLLGLAGYLLVPLMFFILMGAAFFSNVDQIFKIMRKNAERGQSVQLIIPGVDYEAMLRSLPEIPVDTAR